MARTTEPTQIVKGERIEWTRTFFDYPATLWTLEYRYRGAGTGIDVNATADGTDFNCVITAAASGSFGGTGKYHWQAWVVEIATAANTFIVDEGTVNIRPGFSTSSQAAYDMRSLEKQILDAINSTLLNTATNDQMEYEIETPAGRRKIKKMSRTELITLQKHYAGIVSRQNAAERVRNGGQFGTQVRINVRES